MFEYLDANSELEIHQKARYKYYSIKELEDRGLLAKTKVVYSPIYIECDIHRKKYRNIDEPFDF
jgi:hypothetical protein